MDNPSTSARIIGSVDVVSRITLLENQTLFQRLVWAPEQRVRFFQEQPVPGIREGKAYDTEIPIKIDHWRKLERRWR